MTHLFGTFVSMSFLFLGCSGPNDTVDAATPACECPIAEPPLAGRIVTEVSQGVGNIELGSSATGGACSNPKAVVLSGGCQIAEPAIEQSPNVRLVDSFKVVGQPGGQDGWGCTWYNSGTTVGHANMTLTCLNPAQ
jgi:hypothetical protein